MRQNQRVFFIHTCTSYEGNYNVSVQNETSPALADGYSSAMIATFLNWWADHIFSNELNQTNFKQKIKPPKFRL